MSKLSNSKVVFDIGANQGQSIERFKKLFPNAKILNCTRDPLDNCWSIYKNFFPIKTEFVNDFKDITKFYKLYLKTLWFTPVYIYIIHFL